jgi:Flp pilus assembly protein TadD
MNAAVATLLRRAAKARQAGEVSQAVDLCLDVLRRESQNVDACRMLGEMALHGGLHTQAVQMLGLAADQLPHDAALQVNLGAAHQALEQWDAAETCYRRALAIQPSLIQARGNLAAMLNDKGDSDGAEREYRAVLATNPRFADTHVNLGNLLRNRGDLDAAIASYRTAVSCDPSHAMAHNNLGGALLLAEEWSEGWAEFEWRWRLGDNPALRGRHRLPLWQGDPLNGRRILVWGEQGIGDVVLLATMLPDLLAAGAHVTLEVDQRLVDLMQRSFPQIVVVAWGQVPAARLDCQANIGRLGLFLRPAADSFATTQAYLRPDPARVDAFKRRYAALGPGPVIGIAWQSKSTSHRRKSLALDDFAPLFHALPHATFVSLQYGDTADEIARVSQRSTVHIHRDDSFDNWADLDGLAAQIAALDHVVTVSNLNAHLAGACGVPAHVLITQNALWYWPHRKTTTRWYASLRLTRLAERGSTGQAIASVARSLAGASSAAADWLATEQR